MDPTTASQRNRSTVQVMSALLLGSAAALSGCDRKGQNVFTSADLAASQLPTTITDRNPVILKLDDGNLMCVTQVRTHLHVYRTASGYAQDGGGVDLRVVSAGANTSVANVYTEINYLEALTYCGGDWRPIYDAAVHASAKKPDSVDPKLVQFVLEPLTRHIPLTAEDGTALDGPSEVLLEPWEYGVDDEITEGDPMPEFSATLEEADDYDKTPVYFMLADGNLLKVVETVHIRNYMDYSSSVKFFKTSSGYTQSEGHLTVLGFGGSAQRVRANIYTEISADEASAYLGGNSERLLAAAERQSKVFIQSADPEAIAAAMHR